MTSGEVRKSDVIIIGSGSVGNAAAYFLALEGLSVTVLEKDTVGSGASVRNGGQNKMNTRGEPELSLGMYGVQEIWPRLQRDLGVDIEFSKTGGYRNALTEDEMENMQKFWPIAKKYGVAAMYLFGSYARGEATATSDLDFRIERGRIRSLFELSAMYNALSEGFQKDLDLLTSQNIEPEFLAAIRPEEVLVYAQH